MVPTSNKIHGPCIALKNELLPTTNTCHHVFPEFPFDVLLKVKHVIAVESFQISLLFFYLRSNLCQIDKLFMQEHLIYAHIYVDFCYYQQVPFFFFWWWVMHPSVLAPIWPYVLHHWMLESFFVLLKCLNYENILDGAGAKRWQVLINDCTSNPWP